MPSIQPPAGSQLLPASPAARPSASPAGAAPVPPVAPAAAAPADTLAAAPRPWTQALTSVGLFDEPAVRGAKFSEEMALQHDSWGKINSHFKDIYHGSRDSRPQDIAKMAQRLGVAEAELKPLM